MAGFEVTTEGGLPPVTRVLNPANTVTLGIWIAPPSSVQAPTPVNISPPAHSNLLLAHWPALLQRGRQKTYFQEISTPRRALRLAVVSLPMFLGCLPTYAQNAPQEPSTRVVTTGDDKDNKAILEIGAATSWNVSGGAAAFGPNLAVEIEPIENWLELELGVSPFYTHTAKEWDTDLLFKKPWTLSRKAEFMLGIGPQWIHLKQSGGN